jgi:peptide/nickel transport system substrate-binding protein
MCRAALTVLALAACIALCGCSQQKPDAHTAVMLIESSPLNLDPRVGTDAQSERIGELIFEGLVPIRLPMFFICATTCISMTDVR